MHFAEFVRAVDAAIRAARDVRAYDRVLGRDADWRTEFAGELVAKW